MRKTLSTLLVSAMLVTSLTACGEKTEETAATATPAATATAEATVAPTEAATTTASYKDGDFEGTGKGLQGDIKVTVTVKEGKIADIKVTEQKETEGISQPAFDEVPAAIIKKQTTEVDAATGATMSSNGIKEAVADALAKASK